jgi:uncharacterized membrane protein (DUF373 family)
MIDLIPLLLKKIERFILAILIIMMTIVLLLSTYELGRILFIDIFNPSNYLLDISELLDLFGFFMLVLIGLELLETIKAYLNENEIHVEIVLEVALIAVARKVVIIDVKDYEPASLFAIAAIVIALAVAYYLEKVSRKKHTPDRNLQDENNKQMTGADN